MIRTKEIDVEGALMALDMETTIGFEVAQKNNSSLEDAQKEIEIKLCYLYELNCIDNDELSGMLSMLNQKYEDERRKRNGKLL